MLGDEALLYPAYVRRKNIKRRRRKTNTYPGLDSFPMFFSQIRSARRRATNAVLVRRARGTIHCPFLDFYFVFTSDREEVKICYFIEKRSGLIHSSFIHTYSISLLLRVCNCSEAVDKMSDSHMHSYYYDLMKSIPKIT